MNKSEVVHEENKQQDEDETMKDENIVGARSFFVL